MRPSTFVHLDKLPVTVNGKAYRRQLRQQTAELKPVLALADDAPKELRSDTEDLVAQCWSVILGIPADAVPLTQEFYECGGDSVSIIRLVATLRLSTESIAGPVDVASDGIEDVYLCSSTVSGLVLLAATNPQSYFAQHAFRRLGNYDVEKLPAAWKTVVARHPILRTAFVIPPHPATEIFLLRLALGVALGIHGNTDDVLLDVVTSSRSGDLSFLDLAQGRSSASSAFEYIGLADITKASTLAGSRNIFQLLLTENIPELDLHVLPVFGADIHGHCVETNFPLGIAVFLLPQNRGFNIDIEYDSHYLSSHVLATLDAIVHSPTRIVGDIDIIRDEAHTFLEQVGIELTPDLTLTSEPLVHRLIEKTALAYPYRVAVEHTSRHTLTYAELDTLANRNARGLRAHGASLETPIPKDADQAEAVVAIVATMKFGAAFVPLDVSWPPARTQSCVKQCNAAFVVCDAIVPDVARDLPVPFMTVVDLSEGQEEKQYIHEEQTPHSLAYLIFISVSTGEPKRVMIEHRNIMGYVAQYVAYTFLAFLSGLGDIFMALTKGVTLVLMNISDVLTGLPELLNSTCVDYTVLTLAIAQLIHNDVEHAHPKSPSPRGRRKALETACGPLERYGPTEVTVSCVGMTFTKTTQASAGVIGSPYRDTRAYIVDPTRPSRLLPVNAIGELCDPFASGLMMYRLGDRARWTSDGFIGYLGRQDDTFAKLCGLRIDVGEVEDALAGDTFAVVELLELSGAPHLVASLSRTLAPTGEARLALSFDLASDAQGATHLREWLADCVQECRHTVPAYAVPTACLALDAMSQNANTLT
ncbi:hypothetical protein C8Q78DRAFT_1082073 [Trametes maxima]|nr:hypothetical protein C8Q78DRAFT_1082073 [Trametes maxima]